MPKKVKISRKTVRRIYREKKVLLYSHLFQNDTCCKYYAVCPCVKPTATPNKEYHLKNANTLINESPHLYTHPGTNLKLTTPFECVESRFFVAYCYVSRCKKVHISGNYRNRLPLGLNLYLCVYNNLQSRKITKNSQGIKEYSP